MSPDTEYVQAMLDNQVLRDQLATQTQFMQLLTHQLATPLTSLHGSVDLLTEPRLASEQRQEFLQVVQQQVQRLKTLLADLATIRNIETDPLQTCPTTFRLADLVQEVIAGFRPYPIHFELDDETLSVWSDRWQVSQVLVNLISNAIKYTTDGSPVKVVISLWLPGWVEVSVKDRGLGVPLADQPRLFERFYRVRHADRSHIQGTGLGLSLCKLLVENQGGQMGFESTYGQGSRFYFTLPTTPVTVDASHL
jgi:signal transduction histidine kinase